MSSCDVTRWFVNRCCDSLEFTHRRLGFSVARSRADQFLENLTAIFPIEFQLVIANHTAFLKCE